MVKLFFLLSMLSFGQTQVRPEQIKNPLQMRVCILGAPCGEVVPPTTHVYTGQLLSGRFVMDPQTFSNLNLQDPTITRVCVLTWFGFATVEAIQRQSELPIVSITNTPPIPLGNTFVQITNCFTQAGIEAIRPNPFWTQWLTDHGF
jgi:hypothetical protein